MRIYWVNPRQDAVTVVKGRPVKPLPPMWIAEGGSKNKILRSYPSEEEAFYGEWERIKRDYHIEEVLWPGALDAPFSEPDMTLRSPRGEPLWERWELESYFDPVLEDLCKTLTDYCEKGRRLYFEGGSVPLWFKVFPSTLKDDAGLVIAVDGGTGPKRFKFYGSRRPNMKGGLFFAADRKEEPKHTFFLFMKLINLYRKSKGLGSLKVKYLYEIVERDSPAITANNYAAYRGEALKELEACLDGVCRGVSHHGLFGRFGITLYSENSVKGMLPLDKARICRGLLDTFKGLYHFDEAALFCVRDGLDQYLYFIARDVGIFYNSEGQSRSFLGGHGRYLAGALSSFGASVFGEARNGRDQP